MIVCFGGGKGLSSTLAALKMKGMDFAAVVSTTDNGGSTGELRKEFGIPAVGDFRRIVDTISDHPTAPIMESRFKNHAIGNLVILELVDKYGFGQGLEAYRRIMGVSHRIVPQFLEPSDLVAEISGERVFGETEIDASEGKVDKIWIEPELEVNPHLFDLLEGASTIVLGPGSLYTSVVPHLIPRDIRSAISKIPVKVFVVGMHNDIHSVQGFKLSDHIREVEKFVNPDYVLVQSPHKGVVVDKRDKRILEGDMIAREGRHCPDKLGELICRILC